MAPSDRGWEQIRVGIALVTIASITVVLRFIARFVKGLKFEIDDWFSLASLVFLLGMLVELILWATIGGAGRHFQELVQDPAELTRFFKIFLANEFTYGVTSPLVKLTLITFYRRIFSTRNFRLTCDVVAGLSVTWGVIVVIVSGVQCQPLARYWDMSIPGTCINTIAFVQGVQGYNIFLDLVILMMPLPMVWNLHRPLKDKLQLCGVFILGGFVFVASIYRMVTLTQIDPLDLSYTIHTGVVWTFVEPCIGLACANLPIIKGMIPYLNSSSRSSSKGYVHTPFSGLSKSSATANYYQMGNSDRTSQNDDAYPLTPVGDDTTHGSAIHVKTTVEVK